MDSFYYYCLQSCHFKWHLDENLQSASQIQTVTSQNMQKLHLNISYSWGNGLILTCNWGKGTLTARVASAHGVTGDTGFNPLILQSSMLTNESWDLVTSYFCSMSCPCFYSYQRR